MLPKNIKLKLERLQQVARLVEPNYSVLEHDLLLQEVRNLYLELLTNEISEQPQQTTIQTPTPESIQPTPVVEKKEVPVQTPPTPEATFEQYQPKSDQNTSASSSVWENLGTTASQEVKPSSPVQPSVTKQTTTPTTPTPPPVQQEASQPAIQTKPIASFIALADRYYLQRELFGNQSNRMNDMLSSIDATTNYEDTIQLIQPLKATALSVQAFERIIELIDLKYQK